MRIKCESIGIGSLQWFLNQQVSW